VVVEGNPVLIGVLMNSKMRLLESLLSIMSPAPPMTESPAGIPYVTVIEDLTVSLF
jgi:hypothetical protein